MPNNSMWDDLLEIKVGDAKEARDAINENFSLVKKNVDDLVGTITDYANYKVDGLKQELTPDLLEAYQKAEECVALSQSFQEVAITGNAEDLINVDRYVPAGKSYYSSTTGTNASGTTNRPFAISKDSEARNGRVSFVDSTVNPAKTWYVNVADIINGDYHLPSTSEISNWNAKLEVDLSTSPGKIKTGSGDVTNTVKNILVPRNISELVNDTGFITNAANLPQMYKTSEITVPSSSFVSDSTYSGWGYKAAISISGVNSSMYPQVIYDSDTVNKFIMSEYAETYNGGVYVWANSAREIKIAAIYFFKPNNTL